jgi:hypothetical protein
VILAPPTVSPHHADVDPLIRLTRCDSAAFTDQD